LQKREAKVTRRVTPYEYDDKPWFGEAACRSRNRGGNHPYRECFFKERHQGAAGRREVSQANGYHVDAEHLLCDDTIALRFAFAEIRWLIELTGRTSLFASVCLATFVAYVLLA
jgi:hypothetical protein